MNEQESSIRGKTWEEMTVGSVFRTAARTITACGVIFAAGPLGTNKLLQRCRVSGSLPRSHCVTRLPAGKAKKTPEASGRTPRTASVLF